MVKADDATFREVLTRPAQGVLDELIATGAWYEATEAIEAVRVVRLSESARTVSLAVQEPDSSYVLNWRATRTGGRYAFEGQPGPTAERPRASDWAGTEPLRPDDATAFASRTVGGEVEADLADAAPDTLSVFPLNNAVQVFAVIELNKAIQRHLDAPEAVDQVMFTVLATASDRTPDRIEAQYEEGQNALRGGSRMPESDRDAVIDAFLNFTRAQNLDVSREDIQRLLTEVLETAQRGETQRSTPRGNVPIPGSG
ncbi:MAG: hypothetical protein EA378_00330 [Phycisphaerales bacterium]|nr:MAG: hypothetical protein EA378_00330 [Phycisphaerales bacterium]